jgi:hypothetical protein
MPNQIVVDGKNLSGNTTLDIELADDNSDVRGYGQPITPAAAKKMVADYYINYKKIEAFLRDINNDTTGKYGDTKTHANFNNLTDFIDPAKHILSGVFGKEIILQIIAQKDCEGIRYFIGKDRDNKITVILLGVKESTPGISEPLPNVKYIRDEIHDETFITKPGSILGEVHNASLTVEEARILLGNPAIENINDALFGIF